MDDALREIRLIEICALGFGVFALILLAHICYNVGQILERLTADNRKGDGDSSSGAQM